MDCNKLRNQLLNKLDEQRRIQQQASLAIDNARAAEHQILGALFVVDSILENRAGVPPGASVVQDEIDQLQMQVEHEEVGS